MIILNDVGLPDVFCKNTGLVVNSDKNLTIKKTIEISFFRLNLNKVVSFCLNLTCVNCTNQYDYKKQENVAR